MDLTRCPRVLYKTFGPLGVHRVLNLGTEGANSSFEFCPILMPIQVFFFNINTDSMEKILVAPAHTSHKTFLQLGMWKILHIYTFETHCNATISLCTIAVERSHFL